MTLLRGRASDTSAPKINARLLFMRHPDLAGKFKVVAQLDAFGIYTAFSRRHPQAPAMLAAFNDGMKMMQANGVAKSVQARWRQGAATP